MSNIQQGNENTLRVRINNEVFVSLLRTLNFRTYRGENGTEYRKKKTVCIIAANI